MFYFILFIVRIENGENPYPGLNLPVDYDFDLDDIDIENEENDWDPINREFASDFTITSLPDDRGYDLVEVNRDELAYKQQVNLTGYCNAENDQQNNLWVTLESPFLTKKIRQKFPSLPGYVIENNRAVGDDEISITSNGDYILGQNDQDMDDLEMDKEVTTPNQNRSLILSKNEETTPTFVLGKFNVNVPQTLVNNYTQPTITTNGTYTIPNGYTGFNNFTVNVPTPKITQISNYSITQNGTKTIPIPTGYDAVNSISVNVNVNIKFGINYFRFGSDSSTTKRKLTLNQTQNTVTIYNNQEIVTINPNYSSTSIVVSYLFNSNQWTMTRNAGVYYFIGDYSSSNVIYFYDSNNSFLFSFQDNNNGTEGTNLVLPKSLYEIDM